MICVTRLKGQVVALNPDMIESAEANPDTTLRLTSGDTLIVCESVDEIVARVTEYRRHLLAALRVGPLSGSTSVLGLRRKLRAKGA